MTPAFPIAGLLTPPVQLAAPEGFAVVDDAILRGLPHAIPLTGDLRLVLLISTGLIAPWLDADPLLVVSTANAEQVPKTAEESEAVGSAALPTARLVLQEGTTSIASTALTLGKITTLPETGAAVRIQIYVTGWDLRAGSMRGPGNFGSRISLAWRPADAAIVHFSTPPVSPVLVKRLPPAFRIESTVGLVRAVALRRFINKRSLLR